MSVRYHSVEITMAILSANQSRAKSHFSKNSLFLYMTGIKLILASVLSLEVTKWGHVRTYWNSSHEARLIPLVSAEAPVFSAVHNRKGNICSCFWEVFLREKDLHIACFPYSFRRTGMECRGTRHILGLALYTYLLLLPEG